MKLHNTYYLLRHGEAVSNVENLNSSWPETFNNPLTKKGVIMVEKAADMLKNNHAKHGQAVDIILASDLQRTKQTADIVAKVLGLPVKYEKRLREIDFGNLNGKEFIITAEEKARVKNRLSHKATGGESYGDVSRRAWELFKDLEKKYKGKHILLVSHQAPLWLLENKLKKISIAKALTLPREERIGRAELRTLQ